MCLLHIGHLTGQSIHIHTPCSIWPNFKPWLVELVFGTPVLVALPILEARAALSSISPTDKPMAALLGGDYVCFSGRPRGRMRFQGDYGSVTIADMLQLMFTRWIKLYADGCMV